MELRFQPALLQEVIDSFVEKTEREGDQLALQVVDGYLEK